MQIAGRMSRGAVKKIFPRRCPVISTPCRPQKTAPGTASLSECHCLPARRGDEAEHEQYDQQAVEHAAALLPARVLARRDRRGGRDKRLPAAAEAAVGGRRAAPFGPGRRLPLSRVTRASSGSRGRPRRAASHKRPCASFPCRRSPRCVSSWRRGSTRP